MPIPHDTDPAALNYTVALELASGQCVHEWHTHVNIKQPGWAVDVCLHCPMTFHYRVETEEAPRRPD